MESDIAVSPEVGSALYVCLDVRHLLRQLLGSHLQFCLCQDVGETGCPLRTRMTQHQAAIKNAVHFNQQGHEPRVRVLYSAPPGG